MTIEGTPPETGRIQARNEKQAMEWSLVLASQGLNPVLSCDPETQKWELLLPAEEIATALKQLRIYRLENRSWPWQQPVFDYDILFDWGCLAWLVIVALMHALAAEEPLIKTLGRMDGTLVAKGEWWRFFTATWLHGDSAHLASNLSIGIPLMGLAMGRYGTGLGFLLVVLSGAAGNLFTFLIAPHPHLSLGASGVVMGCLGLLAAQSLPAIKSHRHGIRYALAGLFGGAMLFVLLGLTPGTDVLAHFGGFLAGVVLGIPFGWIKNITRQRGTNLAAGVLAACLIVIPWWLAFRSNPAPGGSGNQRADFVSEHDSFEVVRRKQVEHDNWHFVVHAEREGG